MARPVDPEKRLEIARAALAVLRDRGLHGTTMSDVARELGMKRPTLYWYFPDIESIFVFVYDRILADVAAYVGERLLGIYHPLDVLEQLVVAEHAYFVEMGLEDYLLVLGQFWSGGGPTWREDLRRRAVERLTPLRAVLIGAVQGGIEAGRVAPCDAAGLVDLVLAAREGVLLHAGLLGRDPAELHRPLRELVLDPLRREPSKGEGR